MKEENIQKLASKLFWVLKYKRDKLPQRKIYPKLENAIAALGDLANIKY